MGFLITILHITSHCKALDYPFSSLLQKLAGRNMCGTVAGILTKPPRGGQGPLGGGFLLGLGTPL